MSGGKNVSDRKIVKKYITYFFLALFLYLFFTSSYTVDLFFFSIARMNYQNRFART